jgi:hypothetical protein
MMDRKELLEKMNTRSSLQEKYADNPGAGKWEVE